MTVVGTVSGGCHPYLRNVSAFSVNFHLNRWRYSHVTSFLANHAAMFLGPWACGSECCSSNSNASDTIQKGLIGIQSHHPREKMSKKAREKPAEAGSASVSPYGSVPSYELVTSQPNRLINLIWPECRTWFIGPWDRLVNGVLGFVRGIDPHSSFCVYLVDISFVTITWHCFLHWWTAPQLSVAVQQYPFLRGSLQPLPVDRWIPRATTMRTWESFRNR